MKENDEGHFMADPQFTDTPREETRPLYERMAEVETGPIAGTLTASCASVDEMIAAATKQIQRVAGEGRGSKITRVEIHPLLTTNGGDIPVWDATIEFEITEVTA